MTGRGVERLKEMRDWASRTEHSLENNEMLQESSVALPRDCALKHASRLKAWLDDMIFIAEAEIKVGRPPAS